MSSKKIKIGSVIIIIALIVGLIIKNGPVNNYKNPTKKEIVFKRSLMLTDKAVEKIQGGISGQFERLYFGNNGEFSWNILNPNEDSFFDENNQPVKSMLIMATSLSHNTHYSDFDNNYENSILRDEEIKLASQILAPKEADAVLNTTKPGGEVLKITSYSYIESKLLGDKFFAPTATIMNNKNYGLEDRHYRQDGNYFWMSAVSVDDPHKAGYISKCGVFSQMGIEVSYLSVRATANLVVDDILFVSAAKGAKLSGPIGSNALLELKESDGIYDYRLTLKDLSQTVVTSNVAVNNNSVSFDYEISGDGNLLSAIIVDEQENEILYYGQVVDVTMAKSGQAVINLPKDFDNKRYCIKVFSEQYNGDYKTDYASELVELN